MKQIFVLISVLSISFTVFSDSMAAVPGKSDTLKFRCSETEKYSKHLSILIEAKLRKVSNNGSSWWNGDVHFKFENRGEPNGSYESTLKGLNFAEPQSFPGNFSLEYMWHDKDNPYDNGFDFDGDLSGFDVVVPSDIDIVVNNKDGGAPVVPADTRVIPEISRLLYNLEDTNTKKFRGVHFAPLTCQLIR